MHNIKCLKLCAIVTVAVMLCGFLVPSQAEVKAEALGSISYTDEYEDFLYALGTSESTNRYTATNGQYLGYWQLGNLALQEAGFMDSSSNWTETAAKFGITNKEDYLASEIGQEYAVLKYHKRIYYYTQSMGVYSYLDTEVQGIKMTFAGMIAAAHALGVGGLKKLIVNGTSGSSSNDAIALRYMESYGIYDIEATITGNMPVYDVTVTSPTVTTTTTAVSTSVTTTTAVATTASTVLSSTTTTTTTAAVATTSTTTTTTASATATVSTIDVPLYIKVTFSENVATAGELFYIYVESDTAKEYHVSMISPSGIKNQYIFEGSKLGVVLEETGIYQILITASNTAGSSTTDMLYVAVKEKDVVTEEETGDANMDGTVNINDASLILSYYASASAGALFKPTGSFERSHCDVNGDGDVNIADAVLVLRFYAFNAADTPRTWDELIG